MRRWITLGSIGLTLAAAGCDKKDQVALSPAPVEVAVVTVTPQTVSLTRELPGRTAPYRIAEVRPQVNGIIQRRLFTEGRDVKSGQQLLQIDPATYQAAVGNAQAALTRAQAHLLAAQLLADRYQSLLGQGVISKQDNDN